MRVGRLGIGVALGAADLLRRLLMRQALYVRCGNPRTRTSAVHRMLEFALIDIETDRRAVAPSVVRVASEWQARQSASLSFCAESAVEAQAKETID